MPAAPAVVGGQGLVLPIAFEPVLLFTPELPIGFEPALPFTPVPMRIVSEPALTEPELPLAPLPAGPFAPPLLAPLPAAGPLVPVEPPPAPPMAPAAPPAPPPPAPPLPAARARVGSRTSAIVPKSLAFISSLRVLQGRVGLTLSEDA